MPDNQIPATQPEPGAGEFNFAKPAADNPRMKRRSLKAKPEGLLKPSNGTSSAARELEREAPPLSPEQAIKPRGISEVGVTDGRVPRTPAQKDPRAEIAGYQQKPKQASENSTQAVKIEPAVKITEPAIAPPRTTPPRTTVSPATTSSQPASGSTTPKATSTPASTTSPHGTRPATLYYSSSPRKAETPSSMKPTPTASPSPASSSSATTLPTSGARSAAASPRPAATVDYRSNVERQSREQKSVGSILAYIVYALIGLFVVGAALAGYGTYVLSEQIHQQSVTVSDLDARYAAANKDLIARLATMQDTVNQSLSQAQAQIARQQALIMNQQEELNRLIAAANDNATAVKLEKQARTQETAALRARVRDLEYRPITQR